MVEFYTLATTMVFYAIRTNVGKKKIAGKYDAGSWTTFYENRGGAFVRLFFLFRAQVYVDSIFA